MYRNKSVSQKIRRELISKRKHVCQKCRKKKCDEEKCFCEIDHIIPVSKGGTDELFNLQVLCMFCHKDKTYEDIHRR